MGPRLFSVEYPRERPTPDGKHDQLQWGHAYSAWNTGFVADEIHAWRAASMGPRLFSVEYGHAMR